MFRLAHAVRAGLTPILLLLACCFVAGCGGEKSYRVSGKVTFKGQPVPAGKIYFMPDGAKGNSGATGYANISDGTYDTSNGGRGSIGGPMLVMIEGIDPNVKPDTKDDPEAEAKSLFPQYQIAEEMPMSNSTKDFDVPAEAAKGGSKQGGKPAIIIP